MSDKPDHTIVLRDWLAGRALTGIISASGAVPSSPTPWALAAYAVADAMLSARESGRQPASNLTPEYWAALARAEK